MLVKRTFLRVDFLANIEVDSQYYQVGDNVHGTDAHEDLRVVEGYLL